MASTAAASSIYKYYSVFSRIQKSSGKHALTHSHELEENLFFFCKLKRKKRKKIINSILDIHRSSSTSSVAVTFLRNGYAYFVCSKNISNVQSHGQWWRTVNNESESRRMLRMKRKKMVNFMPFAFSVATNPKRWAQRVVFFLSFQSSLTHPLFVRVERNERIIAIISLPASYVSHSSDKMYLHACTTTADCKVFCVKRRLNIRTIRRWAKQKSAIR